MSTTKTDSTAKEKAAVQSSERKTLDLALSAINKQYGDGTLMRMGDATKMQVSTVSTGSVAIDLALGVGGLPRGRIVEIFGPESSGKTTLCLSIIAEIQRQGGNAVFVDVEHALDPRYSKVVGVDLDNLLVSQPESGEDALNIAETLIRSGAVDVIVIDSVAALVSKQELDGQMGDSTIGVQARMMSQAMRRLTAAISRTNCIVIFTNQIREKIGVMFGSPETTQEVVLLNSSHLFESIFVVSDKSRSQRVKSLVTAPRLKLLKTKSLLHSLNVSSTSCITKASHALVLF